MKTHRNQLRYGGVKEAQMQRGPGLVPPGLGLLRWMGRYWDQDATLPEHTGATRALVQQQRLISVMGDNLILVPPQPVCQAQSATNFLRGGSSVGLAVGATSRQ